MNHIEPAMMSFVRFRRLVTGTSLESPARYRSYEDWLNSKYGPNYAEHGGTYQIKWEHFVYSEETGCYELHLDRRRNNVNYWYNQYNS